MGHKRKTKNKKKSGPGISPAGTSRFFDLKKQLTKAVRYHQSGRLDKAEQAYAKILRVHPDLPDGLHLRGFVAYQLGKNAEAIAFISKAIAKNSSNPTYHYNLALPLLAENRHDEAISSLQKAIQLNPQLLEAHVNLGNIFQHQGRFNEAVLHYERALQLNPDDFLVHVNMGNVLQARGRFKEAIGSYEKALHLHPALSEAYYNMGNAYKSLGKIEKAISWYQRAVSVNPDDFKTHFNMGNAFQDLKKPDDAVACYQKAIRISPDRVEAYYHLGDVFSNQGRFQEAIPWYRKALELRPDCAEAFFSMVKGRKITQDDAGEIFEIANRLQDVELSANGRVYMHFALGKVFDDLRLFEKAFQHYREANKQERSTRFFDHKSHGDFINRIIQVFDADFFIEQSSWGNDTQMPVFIIGMPRSGTSLVEQIISSHPKVFGGGELDFFFRLNAFFPHQDTAAFPGYIKRFDGETARRISDGYLELIHNLSESYGTSVRVTDKMPHNFLFLGLLSVLFPRARFIHCERHPLDTCLSIYFQKFARGHDYAYDLGEIGRYYKDYRRLMTHWYRVLPAQVFQTRYEDLVCRQEEVSRRLIDFCGLEWDSNCLQFHKNQRPVYTSSHWQVRQPIYTSSVQRWKNYDRFIGPLKDVLAQP